VARIRNARAAVVQEYPDMAETLYNTNPELLAMKNDIADRKFRIRMIGMAVATAFALTAFAAVVVVPVLVPEIAATALPLAKFVLAGGLGLASAATTLFTMKEVKKLEMDEKFVQSYMQGKNYWGEGYRQEVAEHGYSIQAPHFQGAPPPSLAKNNVRAS